MTRRALVRQTPEAASSVLPGVTLGYVTTPSRAPFSLLMLPFHSVCALVPVPLIPYTPSCPNLCDHLCARNPQIRIPNPSKSYTHEPSCSVGISSRLSPQALQAPKVQDPSGPKDAPSSSNPRTNPLRPPTRNPGEARSLSGEPRPAPLPPRSVSRQACPDSHSYCTTLALATSHRRDRACLLTGFSASRPATCQAVPVHTQWFCSRTKTGASCFS